MDNNHDPIPEKLMNKIRTLSGCDNICEIPAFSGYAITPDGDVWSVRPRATSRKLTDPPVKLKRKQWKGYEQFNLYQDGHCFTFTVGRLMLITFVSEPPFPNAQAMHKDGNTLNTNLDNLEWANLSTTHGAGIIRNGGAFIWGEDLNHSKLTPETVKDIREDFAAGVSKSEIIKKYGVTRRTIERAVKREAWKQVE